MNPKFSVGETGPRIAEFLTKIIADAGFDLEFAIEPGSQLNPEFETPDITVKFTGGDVDLLLGNRAELLLALEQVAMEMLRMHSDDHSRVSFDANDYRALRIQELLMSAQAAAEKVKQGGQPFHFNPMNSRERRVLHIALRNETELRSESAGSGPYRNVIIYPAGMPSLPEPEVPAFPPRGRPSMFGDRPPVEPTERGRFGRGGGRGGPGGGRGGRPGGGDRGGRSGGPRPPR